MGEGAINNIHILMRINWIHKLLRVDRMMDRLEGLISSILEVDLGVSRLGHLVVAVVAEEGGREGAWDLLDRLDLSLGKGQPEIKEEGWMRMSCADLEGDIADQQDSFLDSHLPHLSMDKVMVELPAVHRRRDQCSHLISYVCCTHSCVSADISSSEC